MLTKSSHEQILASLAEHDFKDKYLGLGDYNDGIY